MTRIQKRIDSFLYDTGGYSTQRIAVHGGEGLYRTDDGTLFFAGESGPRMRYGKNCEGGGKVGGEGLSLVDRDEADAWIESLPEKDRAAARMNLDGFLIV